MTLIIEGQKPPIINTLTYCYIVRQAREFHPVRDRLIIELPKKPNIKPKEYVKVPTTPEPNGVQPYHPGTKGADKSKAQ